MNESILNEGLRTLDLENLVHPIFTVDTFKSKMGEDQDVCVLSFHVKERHPARDLMEFIEKGYGFVLDADVSSGENNAGEYHVFVEVSRTPKLAEQIKEMLYGIKKLTGIDEWEFKYHKDKSVYDVSEEVLKKIIPATPGLYEDRLKRYKIEDLKTFFDKTLMDDLSLEENIITIFKPFGKTVHLQMIREGDKENILEDSNESLSLDNDAMGEIFWLTKVLGDYNINKVGDTFVFENGKKAMILKRIEK
jgi:hypothetical protein